jgi:glycogen phosphorylase
MSILDGWWAEGYAPGVGWAIGHGEDYEEGRDAVEANLMFTLLETEVTPMFFERDSRDCPTGWVKMMKASIKRLASWFSTDRMVGEYVDRFYIPTARRYKSISQEARIEEVALWKRKVRQYWPEVQVLDISAPVGADADMGQPYPVNARVRLGNLAPIDVEVQLYQGTLDAKDELHDASTVAMNHLGGADGVHNYTCNVPFKNSGRHGYTVRVIPKHERVLIPHELTLIRWAGF